jgi:hypothetical protein
VIDKNGMTRADNEPESKVAEEGISDDILQRAMESASTELETKNE